MTRARVRLEQMSEQRYLSWFAETTSGFAAQQVEAGVASEPQARKDAARQFDGLLPLGLATPGQHVWSAFAGDTEVGYLWLGLRTPGDQVEGYVYDVAVPAHLRGRGFGRAILLAGEHLAHAMGATALELNVFAHNIGASQMYANLGYAARETHLTRRLDTTSPLPGENPPWLRLEPTAPMGTLPGRRVWFAYDGEQEIGTSKLDLGRMSEDWHGFGLGVHVRKEFRGRGHARLILAATEQTCRGQGVVTLRSTVPATQPAWRSLLDGAGFEVTATLMHKELAPGR